MAAALREAGNTDVDLVEIHHRNHDTVWSGMTAPDDEVAPHIIEFVRHLDQRRVSSPP